MFTWDIIVFFFSLFSAKLAQKRLIVPISAVRQIFNEIFFTRPFLPVPSADKKNYIVPPRGPRIENTLAGRWAGSVDKRWWKIDATVKKKTKKKTTQPYVARGRACLSLGKEAVSLFLFFPVFLPFYIKVGPGRMRKKFVPFIGESDICFPSYRIFPKSDAHKFHGEKKIPTVARAR